MFILIALFVSAIVISNSVDTAIAGRRGQLTLLRLIGASGRQLRAGLVRAVGAVAAVGAAVGTLSVPLPPISPNHSGAQAGKIPEADYSASRHGRPSRAGRRRTAVVATSMWHPSHPGLIGCAADRTARRAEVASCRRRTAAFGALILGLACRMGGMVPAGFFAAFSGAALVSVGFLIKRPVIVPRLVSGADRAVVRARARCWPARTRSATPDHLVGRRSAHRCHPGHLHRRGYDIAALRRSGTTGPI